MINLFDKVFPIKTAFAHCDIPCGIYDPHPAQIATHTVIRMVNMINDLPLDAGESDEELKKSHQQIARLVRVKEKHAAIVEQEIVTLWGDYFKEEHFKAYPELTNTVQKILKLASKARQEINLEAAKELLAKVQEVAEIFYKTKDRKTVRVKSPYPTEGDLVVPA